MKDKEKEVSIEEEQKQVDSSDNEEQTSEIEEEGEDEKKEDEKSELDQLNNELGEAKDKYLRLYSEFENFRRRTARERLELIKGANEDLLVHLLPVLDDFERAQKAIKESENHAIASEGFDLIFNKLRSLLEQKGLKEMEEGAGTPFNSEVHHAISQMPVEKKKMKGKIIDVVEKGYCLNDKVIRFAKVVTGK